jgi:L-lactate dehydrogenase complex protein LldE
VEVALFVPCYVDQLAPQVAAATLRVLERVGCSVRYDPDQTCCGQPFLNLGAAREAIRLAERHLARFAGSDAIVCPSASCVATVRHRYPELGVAGDGADARQRARTFELAEFLVDELGASDVGARFPHRVALLPSCHGLRDLGLGHPSERIGTPAEPGPVERLLRSVAGLELAEVERSDECCGFGGAFSVAFPEVSGRMGRARLAALARSGAAFVTATDTSCLLHLDGIRRRAARTSTRAAAGDTAQGGEDTGPRAIHLAEILASREGA